MKIDPNHLEARHKEAVAELSVLSVATIAGALTIGLAQLQGDSRCASDDLMDNRAIIFL